MEQMSVTQFAGELKMPAAVLLEQLKRAGVEKSGPTDLLTEQDKARLLDYLRRSHRRHPSPRARSPLTRKRTDRDPRHRLHRACAHGAGRGAQEAHLRQARRTRRAGWRSRRRSSRRNRRGGRRGARALVAEAVRPPPAVEAAPVAAAAAQKVEVRRRPRPSRPAARP